MTRKVIIIILMLVCWIVAIKVSPEPLLDILIIVLGVFFGGVYITTKVIKKAWRD